jgi:hypothetical protein
LALDGNGSINSSSSLESMATTAHDRALVLQIRRVVQDMPAIETHQDVLKKELANSRRRGTERGVDVGWRNHTRDKERHLKG